jgi:hypothetical protein
MYTNTSSAIGDEERRHWASHVKSFEWGIFLKATSKNLIYVSRQLNSSKRCAAESKYVVLRCLSGVEVDHNQPYMTQVNEVIG